MEHSHSHLPQGLDATYLTNRTYILAVLRRRCRWLSDEESESIMHDAYVVLLERCRAEELTFASEAHVRAFLTRTALHKALDHRKSARWRLSVALEEESELPAAVSREASLEERVVLREAIEQIERAIAAQPARRRSVLGMRLLAEQTPAEVQERLGISERVYRRELERGRRALVRSLNGDMPALVAQGS